MDWIWDLKVPPKVRTFLWRACHEIIPTRAALTRRHVGTNPFYELCSNMEETGSHLFFQCSFFSCIWCEEPFSLTLQASIQSFAAWVRQLQDSLNEAKFGLASVVCWNIWNFRNGWVHSSTRGDRESLVARSRDFLESFKSARFNFSVGDGVNQNMQWTAPSGAWVKVNFDAALYDSGIYQIATVARIGTGDVFVGEYRG